MTKRTTLILDDQMLRNLKTLAARKRQTLSSVVDQFLRYAWKHLAEEVGETCQPRPLPPGKSMGTPAVDVTDREALDDFLEAND